VTEGFTQTLEGKQREMPATEKILGGKQEAQLIAMRLGPRRKAMPIGRSACWLTNW